eukprot:374498-Karenia_brevis.AAC.1
MQNKATVYEWLAAWAPTWRKCGVSAFAKYLGIFLGPEAHTIQWLGVASKWRATSRAVGDCPSAASLATLAYNSRGVTKLSYVGQMLEVPKDVLRAERAVLQPISKTPYNSFSTSAFFNLRMWGGPKFVSTFVLNQAARLRYWKSAEHQ